jgi:hypothetical protein
MRGVAKRFAVLVMWAKELLILIVDIRKDRGNNPLQDSPVKESAIRLFS